MTCIECKRYLGANPVACVTCWTHCMTVEEVRQQEIDENAREWGPKMADAGEGEER